MYRRYHSLLLLMGMLCAVWVGPGAGSARTVLPPTLAPSPSPSPQARRLTPESLGLEPPASAQPSATVRPESPRPVLAIVNERFLLRAQVERKVNALLKNEEETREITDPRELERFREGFAETIVNNWIDTVLLAEEAVRRGFSASEAEVDARIARIKQDTGLEDARLRAVIESAGLTQQEMRREIADIILAEKLIESVAKDYMTDENLRKIYEAIPQSFQELPKVHLLHIVKTPRDPYNYQERQRLKKELEKIRKDILNGADFAEMARRHSDGLLREYGGDLGWVGPQNNLPELINEKGFTVGHMGFKLKPGEVSDVMESKYGFHLIKVLEKRPASGETFDKAREAVKNFVRDETGRRLIKQIRESGQHKIIINLSGVPERYTKNLKIPSEATAAPTP